jgi:hypothetical protein
MLSKRLLPVLGLLSLSAVAVGQSHPRMPVVPSSCRVTKPQIFIPPPPYAAKPSLDQLWFGTDKLWTALPITGTWSGLPHYTDNDQTYYRNKLIFWRQGYDPHREPRPNVSARAKIDRIMPRQRGDAAE